MKLTESFGSVPPPLTNRYIGNLDPSVTEDYIKMIFSKLAPVKRCKLIQGQEVSHSNTNTVLLFNEHLGREVLGYLVGPTWQVLLAIYKATLLLLSLGVLVTQWVGRGDRSI